MFIYATRFRRICCLVALLAAGAALTAAAPAQASVAVPPGVTAGVAVFDRRTGAFTEQLNTATQFRSASVVKLLIALDFLWDRGPDYAVPAADRTRLDTMLKSSDDAAATYYWVRNGYEAVVNRMVPRLGLLNTAPPPAAQRGTWGYTAISAADVVRVYRYLLDSAPAPVRDLILGDLRASTPCGTDGYDQSFGIVDVFAKPWAVKQGWSGFGAAAPGPCNGGTGSGTQAVDTVREALHTTGLVGSGDRSIVVVLTLHPDGTPYAAAVSALDQIVRGLNVPGGAPAPPPTGVWFGTWGSGVRVRSAPTTAATVLATLPAGADVRVTCQVRGEEVIVEPYRNDWWAYLPDYGGYLTNIYVESPDNQLPGVPTC